MCASWPNMASRLVSITQELGDDPAQVMMRQVIALFDEYQSKENAKHVLRSMKENARQGYWNGSEPPFGYQAVEVERRGSRIKKRLAIDPVEAETVRLIFRLFLEGDDGSGPMGVKSIAVWLNTQGYRTRGGATWGIGPIHALLTNPVYAGQDALQLRRGALASSQEPWGARFCQRTGDRRTRDVREGSRLAQAAQPARDATAGGHGSDPAHGIGGLRHLSRGHDAQDRHLKDRQGASVLFLLDLRPAGPCGLQGPLDPHGQARQPRHHPSRPNGCCKPERLRAMLASLASRRAAKAAAVDRAHRDP